jgi:DNA-binding beta-propeller fold protein YncE
VIIGLLCAGLTGVSAWDATQAHGQFSWRGRTKHYRFLSREKSFQRIATFANYRNSADVADETVSEIVAATANGKMLIYTDSVRGEVGFIDITNPHQPQPAGKLPLDPDPNDAVGYSPTSVAVLGNQYALVGVDTSAAPTSPSGVLAVIDLSLMTIVREIDLGGQPDSVKISPDRDYAAIAIENQRDETICVGGVEDGNVVSAAVCSAGGGLLGGLPQTPFGNPAGYLVVIELSGAPAAWVRHDVSLTGLALYAPDDPEPEFVDINKRNEAVVTLQENNHIAIVDLVSRTVVDHFPAGGVSLDGVDATEDGVIVLDETLPDRPREPDAVAWVPGPRGRYRIATANEGDLVGGTRGFSIFKRDGTVAFDTGNAFERIAVQHGHYPEDRSENKGTEPEAIEYARFGHDEDGYLFVGSERGGFIGVYELDRYGRPEFAQLLPAPLEPEGLLAIPHRNLLIASGEVDDPSFGVRSTVMIYELKRGTPAYPHILSEDRDGSPIPWSALSGMTAVPGRDESLLAVWDSYYSESRIFRIDVSDRPPVITEAITLEGGGGNYDPEGIAVAPDHTIWIASEGNATDTRPNLLLQVDYDGNVLDEIGLPQEILDCRAATANRGTLGSGFEGVAILRSHGDFDFRRDRNRKVGDDRYRRSKDRDDRNHRYDGDDDDDRRRYRGTRRWSFKSRPKGWFNTKYRLLVAQQRGWDYTTDTCQDLDDDDGGLNALGEPNRTRIWVYDPETDEWDHVAWELAPRPANAAWVGLSEITETAEAEYVLIERDNLTGDFSELKTLVKVTRHDAQDRLISQGEKAVFNLLPRLRATNGWITDKPEGVAITRDGRTYLVTDNDGVEDWSGETWFLDLGRYWRLFY